MSDTGPYDSPEATATSGSDAAEPRSRRADPPLDRQEQRLLAELSRRAPAVVDAVEDHEVTASAARDDGPIPGPGGPVEGDQLSPVFREPSD